MAPLAERLADLVGRPVMVLDPALRPLATARWPDELQPHGRWLSDGHGDNWWQGGQQRGERPALAPIAVGSHFGGYLAVWDGAAPLDHIDARAIEHAATIFALEMLHERTSYELELRLKGDLLRDLSSGEYRDDHDIQRILRAAAALALLVTLAGGFAGAATGSEIRALGVGAAVMVTWIVAVLARRVGGH
jgi:purine catabolism regulator